MKKERIEEIFRFKEEVLTLIGQYFGGHTRWMYDAFYEGKTPPQILASLKELLEEVAGDSRAQKILLPLRRKYHLK